MRIKIRLTPDWSIFCKKNPGLLNFNLILITDKAKTTTASMAKHVGFLLIVLFVTALSAQSCSNADGFLATDYEPSADDVVHFFDLVGYFNGSVSPGVNFTLLASENQTVAVNFESQTGFYDTWGLGENGGMSIPFFGDYEYEVNSTYAILLSFNPPVTTINFKTNYDPSFNVDAIGGPPLFTTYNEEGMKLNCYRVDLIAPISFNSSTQNGYEFRGVTDERRIATLRVEGAQIVIFDIKVVTSPIPPPVSEPIVEPMTVPEVTSAAVSTVAATMLVPLVLLL